MTQQLATQQTQLSASPDPVYDLMQRIVDGGITSESVGVMERLMTLHERNQDKHAEQEFAKAFVQLQNAVQFVKAIREVKNTAGIVMYRFASFSDIMDQIRPFTNQFGFALSFDSVFEDGRTVSVLTISHIAGHSEKRRFAARIGKGPPNCSESQADESADSLAKRVVLCNALNIVIDKSVIADDARLEGDVITKEQADYIRQLIRETKTDTEKFLALAQADSIEKIRTARLDELMGVLERRKKRVECPKATDPDQTW